MSEEPQPAGRVQAFERTDPRRLTPVQALSKLCGLVPHDVDQAHLGALRDVITNALAPAPLLTPAEATAVYALVQLVRSGADYFAETFERTDAVPDLDAALSKSVRPGASGQHELAVRLGGPTLPPGRRSSLPLSRSAGRPDAGPSRS
jgi:hypothetical protein